MLWKHGISFYFFKRTEKGIAMGYSNKTYVTTSDEMQFMKEESMLAVKQLFEHVIGLPPSGEFRIKRVIFNEPATIVLWKDGTKTVVKCHEGDTFDKEKGLAMCFAKKALNNKYGYYNVFLKHCK